MMSNDSYSISQARDHLARLVHEAEAGGPIELTRRGEPVAVVLAIDEYRRICAPRPGLWSAISRFRAQRSTPDLGVDPDELLDGARDPDQGRDFGW